MTERKFTPPKKFPAEYVDEKGNKAVILGRGPHERFPLIGYDAEGYATYWTELGAYHHWGSSDGDLHDITEEANVTQQALDGRKELETELEKAMEALRGVNSFVRELEPYADQGHKLAPALKKACDILEELEGLIDD